MQQHDSNYFAPRLPLSPTLGNGFKSVKIYLLQNMVVLHIKLKRMTNAATCKHIFRPYIHPRPLQWDQRKQHFY